MTIEAKCAAKMRTILRTRSGVDCTRLLGHNRAIYDREAIIAFVHRRTFKLRLDTPIGLTRNASEDELVIL
jgi:hypothetical protein